MYVCMGLGSMPTICGGEDVDRAVVLLVVELQADVAANLLPVGRVDLVHHVHQDRVEDREGQRLCGVECSAVRYHAWRRINWHSRVYVCMLYV